METQSPHAGRDVTVLPAGLRAWRKQRDFTQGGLSEASGVSESLIALIETNKRQPGLANAIALAKALDIDLDVFALIHVDTSSLNAPAEAA